MKAAEDVYTLLHFLFWWLVISYKIRLMHKIQYGLVYTMLPKICVKCIILPTTWPNLLYTYKPIEIQFISLFAQLVFAKGCKSFFKQMEYSSLMNILQYLRMEFCTVLKRKRKYINTSVFIRRKDHFAFIYFI